ncbi:hypothetical protein HA402_013154 [Bradysia odoriphaga]|nr:hypothetical protein HA402_013154 [Bradysia odoriphaga]
MLTYHVLAKQAAIIARVLQSKGIISQAGILIAQGSCVPLDPNMPEDRLNDMLHDLQIQWTISTSLEKHKNLHTTLLDFHDLTLNQQHINSTYDDISPKHRTHILFTSGTTGKPKAVEIEAKGILRLVVNPRYINLTADDRIASIANPTFDASLFEVWGALLNGATTVIIPKEDVLNIQYFQQELIRQKITIMFITTSLFNLVATTFPQAFRFIRYLLVGGEALNPHTLKFILNTAPPQHLLNAYGPTESTTFAMTHDIQTDDLTSGSVPIGKPIDRTTAFILDDCLQPVVQGDVGHLYIGGDGLARGYWNRDTLNKERFVSVSLPGYSTPLRLYQTGDLSLQRDDGVFMYYGRIDNQVKIRGHRIELEEIECQIIKSGQVKVTSVILVKKENAEPFLAAFIVPLNPGSFRSDILDEKLHQYLPEYMLPRLFVVDTIPLTPTGKTDKQRLLMQLVESTATVERPDMFNDTEYALLLIWQKVLNKTEIDLDDNFFRLGGSSLQAASLVIELGRQFTRHFSVQTLYDAPTLRKLANIISQKNVTRQQDEVAHWLQDAKLPDDIQALSGDLQNWSILKDATVMLTGATGYLGAFFLRDLLATPNIKQIICLIRATDEMTARLRIKQNLLQYGLWDPVFNQRITIITGDLSLPKLGLSDDLYHSLAVESDAIFHLGAHVNYIQPYQAHRSGNIEGTLNILRLATQSKPKPLHYVSTIAAYGPAGLFNKVSRIYENDDLTPFLEGLKYDSGGCIAIGAYPILPRQRKEFIPVDYVSAALLTIAKDNTNLGQAYHLVPPDHAQSIDLDQFFELICKSGYRLQKLPYSEWITRLEADPELYDNPLMPLLPMLSETVYQKQTRWEVYENMPAYDASNAQTALAAANSHLKFTPMDKHLLLLHLDFWRRRNGLLPGKKN